MDKRYSDEFRQKVSKSMKLYMSNPKNREFMSQKQKGRKKTPEHIRKISESMKRRVGSESSGWRGGVTPENIKIRNSRKYKDWRNKIFLRDNYTCQVCFKYSGRLHVDHLKPFNEYPKLMYEVSNGRTLCIPCHYYVTYKRKLPDGSKWGLGRLQVR